MWRNYIKRQREKATGPTFTAAMCAGVCARALTWRQVLSRRIFPRQVDLPPEWQDYCRREIPYEVPCNWRKQTAPALAG